MKNITSSLKFLRNQLNQTIEDLSTNAQESIGPWLTLGSPYSHRVKLYDAEDLLIRRVFTVNLWTGEYSAYEMPLTPDLETYSSVVHHLTIEDVDQDPLLDALLLSYDPDTRTYSKTYA